MDVTFPCTSCNQILEADAALADTQIQCPTCGVTLTIPHPDLHNVKVLNPIATSAAAREEKHFTVPVREGPSEILVAKPKARLPDVPDDGRRHLRVKSIRRIDCVEVGHDRFDEVVTEFLEKVGEENLVSVTPITYTYIDIGSQKLLTDFGILILYKVIPGAPA
jgi:hypothetical protein